jgi:hypothetical protein
MPNTWRRTTRLVRTALLTLLLAGCQAPTPRLGTETTEEGLVRVDNSSFNFLYVRPNTDFSRYDAIKLEDAGIAYASEEERSRLQTSRETEFPVPERAKRQIREIFAKAFISEMGKSRRFRLVDRVGPHVLLVRGALVDVVSFVPPEGLGRTDVHTDGIGAATLMIEVSDSETRAVLARVEDRRIADRPGGNFEDSSPVTNARDVRQLAHQWAQLCRKRLDEVAELGALGSTTPGA